MLTADLNQRGYIFIDTRNILVESRYRPDRARTRVRPEGVKEDTVRKVPVLIIGGPVFHC